MTGTFDDWRKTVKLEQAEDGVFKKTVELPKVHTQYKVRNRLVMLAVHVACIVGADSANTPNSSS